MIFPYTSWMPLYRNVQRIQFRRGLYRFANGRTANADINGAANILRKSKQNFDFEELCKGLLDSPLRIRLS